MSSLVQINLSNLNKSDMIVVNNLNHKSDCHRTWTFEVLVNKFEVFGDGL